jgi:hypothetical protein
LYKGKYLNPIRGESFTHDEQREKRIIEQLINVSSLSACEGDPVKVSIKDLTMALGNAYGHTAS